MNIKKQLYKKDVLGKLNFQQIFNYYFPEMEEEEVEFLLWEETCYPFSLSQTLKDIYNIYLEKNKIMKEEKGKLHILYRGGMYIEAGGDLFHGVRKSNVENILARHAGRNIISWEFRPTKTNRQMRLRGSHTNFNK